MTRIRLIVEYDGTDYVGWQVQPNGIAIQQLLEAQLHEITGEKTVLHASGRTDSGVHARAQVAHFDTPSRIPPEKISYALNTGLPQDIRILHSEEAPTDFHARFSVKEKHYRYKIHHAPHASALNGRYSLHIHTPLDFDAMQKASADILGEHDFRAFKSKGTALKSTVRNIYASQWTKEGHLLQYDVCGSGFMYNMVRILVGTMIEIGQGRKDSAALKNALVSLKRSDAGATAPAHGLELSRIVYDDGFDTEDYV